MISFTVNLKYIFRSTTSFYFPVLDRNKLLMATVDKSLFIACLLNLNISNEIYFLQLN